MSKNFRFGTVEVICEGYDKPGDPYVLEGSCSLHYTLEYTSRGKSNQKKRKEKIYQTYTTSEPDSGLTTIFSIFVILIFVFLVIYLSRNCRNNYSYSVGPGGYPTQTTFVNSGYNSYWPWYGMGYSAWSTPSYRSSYSSYGGGSSYSSYGGSSSSSYSDDSSTRTSTGYGGTSTR
jgi:hypothetical protein